MAALLLAGAPASLAQAPRAPVPPRANSSGPTVEQLRAFPLNLGGRRLRPGPIQRVGPFPYWYNLGDGIAVGFANCGSDARCETAILFTTLGQISEAASFTARQAVTTCSADSYNILIGPSQLLGAGQVGMFLPIPLDNGTRPARVHASAASFRTCLQIARETFSPRRSGGR